jgi:hypothetical protein
MALAITVKETDEISIVTQTNIITNQKIETFIVNGRIFSREQIMNESFARKLIEERANGKTISGD